jgi:transcription termination factor Rho
MSDQLIVERGGLEKKDKSELQAIVSALGGSAPSRARKADLIDQILELSGAATADSGTSRSADRADSADPAASGTSATADPPGSVDADVDSSSDEASDVTGGGPGSSAATPDTAAASGEGSGSGPSRRDAKRPRGGRRSRPDQGSASNGAAGHPVGPDGEPLADWEVAMLEDSQGTGVGSDRKGQGSGQSQQGRGRGRTDKRDNARGGNGEDKSAKSSDGESAKGGNGSGESDEPEPSNRRNRRRGRGRGRDRDEAGNDPVSSEPVAVAGYLDLREEGYGFLRVAGNLPSKEDVYVSVKQVRQFGLRRGDHMTGTSRPANRNEKNPGFHQIDTVNGEPPEESRNRIHFDDLTPLFPDERLVMEMREEPLNMTTRVIDLVAPIGKGQRGLIVSPPKAGKTRVMKDIARAIETNNPEVQLLVLLVDERPEEVTDMERHLERGEVAASTFDRPPEEHCAVAELTIERAKRLVEQGRDVVVILDGITRLARAYNLVAPQTGRSMSGGVDAGALYPPKRFFGAARNLEEGGSLTILATALVETGSRMDEVIFEEFKGTGNCEIRLDRRLAEKRIFPAIDVDGSSTRHEELLFERAQLQQAWKLRRVLSGMSEEGSSAAAIEMLIDRLKTFKANAGFLAEIGKAPSV